MSRIEDAEKDYLSGMKYKDIAEKYGVSLNTVKSWKSRNGWQRDATKKKGAHKKEKRVHTKKSKVAQARSPDVIDELVENDELKDRQKAFCLYYLQRYNATWAYQKAYGVGYNTASVEGHKTLRNPKIKKQLTELKKQQSAELYATANDIMLGYLKQAHSDVTDALEFKTVKRLSWNKIPDDTGPYEDANGHYRLDPKIDPETGEQAFYYENLVLLKDSSKIDTSNIKSIRIDKGEAVVEMYDKQKAMKELLERLPEPDNSIVDDDGFIKAIEQAIPSVWANAEVEGMEDENNGEDKHAN
ncbi:phage terminase small subunit [Ligilactobacillus murinus DSM 20452 = NBRC 14221]|uniref:Phage terminase small subunit n=1 Tax=Ligilactobacillus murinus DSM 20452 = NBRC 14221 TaxID=1423772 RepID=A0A0R2B3P3_9LACO|nr:terminase small subunit [Ligilactobacillus murinus]KRM73690.1 phage terminase small subunit [Ligilactobacillus murinus DSM 20452 = NBRC 14221]